MKSENSESIKQGNIPSHACLRMHNLCAHLGSCCWFSLAAFFVVRRGQYLYVHTYPN